MTENLLIAFPRSLSRTTDAAVADLVESATAQRVEEDSVIRTGVEALKDLRQPCEVGIYQALRDAGLSRLQVAQSIRPILNHFGKRFATVLRNLRETTVH